MTGSERSGEAGRQQVQLCRAADERSEESAFSVTGSERSAEAGHQQVQLCRAADERSEESA
ncbi:hypothetical protein GCM10017581_096980 [Dactylosporangium matsuzakiense]|uniref:Uncharacterized protein n=1 Tax=Dactylosporangium matsuzakiense TaxID=53360 RepID=A0A9W6KWE3_9ACTN|nr:hypothetical protein GCM10017581_096980 [Dactylosporangium matsuzakiense]